MTNEDNNPESEAESNEEDETMIVISLGVL